MEDKRLPIIVLGQVPPPLGGQAVAIEMMLKMEFDAVDLIHVPMSFSNDMSKVGRAKLTKLAELLKVIFSMIKAKYKYSSPVIYYPPAGPNLVPMLRDVIILNIARFLFKKRIFHFHASGLSEKCRSISPIIRWIFLATYYKPDFTIRTSNTNINDSKFFGSKNDYVVYYGISEGLPKQDYAIGSEMKVIYMSVIKESKGIFDLINAVAILERKGIPVSLHIAGQYDSDTTEQKLLEQIETLDLKDKVLFYGAIDGSLKEKFFINGDVFCFPTYFESESFGIVSIEAMSYGLPIVATKWRSIPEIVGNGEQGLLVDTKNPTQIASALEQMYSSEEMRKAYGESGVKKFNKSFKKSVFQENLNSVFSDVANSFFREKKI